MKLYWNQKNDADPEARLRTAFRISNILLIGFIAGTILYAYLGIETGIRELFILAGMSALAAIASVISMRFSRHRKADQAMGIVITAVMIASLVTCIFLQGLGWILGAAQFTCILLISMLAVSRKYWVRLMVANFSVTFLTILVDGFGGAGRQTIPALQILIPTMVILGLLSSTILILREFKNFSLRVKIILGILVPGGAAIAVLAYLAAVNTLSITNSLSSRLETSVSLLGEEQLINTVFSETSRANQSFENIKESVASLASFQGNLRRGGVELGQGTYWDARTRLIQLEGGQYGNSPDDVSSVYVPAKVELNDRLIARLNESAYLDFYAPEVLETHPTLLALYSIDTQGVTRYYPNINLATLLPPDFDPTSRGYYEITSPLFNPQRQTRWSIPYVDATGGGLVVTVAAPVYFSNEFGGIIAADMGLATITRQIENISIGQTGYAFMLDDAGRIISMPAAGYSLYGIKPDEVNPEEYFKQTVLGLGTQEIQSATNRMVAGGSGLLVVRINGVNTYMAFAPIQANGYSIALVVPVSELQGAISVAQSETRGQITTAARSAFILLAVIFLFAVLISLLLGGIIAGPIVRLTANANQIVEGDLTAKADVSSRDETGALALAFNTMTNRLRDTLAGLELRVEERTRELLAANRKIEQRALRFEGIARVARTISSTRELDTLLPQIASAISRQFGFYHVGIFLLDPGREYAILSASNSEGGAKMLAQNHRLKVGETGIVGYVTGSGKPRVAFDTDADDVFFNNSLLPETRSEIALPLLADTEVIGALDVQSKSPNAFDQEDISILATLADQVSIAIQNARQHEANKLALAESESLSRMFVRSGWQEFRKKRKITGIRHSGVRTSLVYEQKGKGGNLEVSEAEQPRGRARSAGLILPITLRGEPIGNVNVRAPGNRQWSQDELDIVSAILDRAALALENARLLEDSQKRAVKERVIGEISAKISAQNDIDELLKTAALELSRTLPGAEVAVQVTKDWEIK